MEAKTIGAPWRSAWRAALDLLRSRAGRVLPRQGAFHFVSPAPTLQLEKTLGAVDFLAHVDNHLRFLYVSDASVRLIWYGGG